MESTACVAFVVCADITRESGQRTLHHVIDSVGLGSFPETMPRVCMYVVLRGFRRKQEIRLRILLSRPGSTEEEEITEPLVISSFVEQPLEEVVFDACINNLVIREAGQYRFVLEADRVFLSDRIIPITKSLR